MTNEFSKKTGKRSTASFPFFMFCESGKRFSSFPGTAQMKAIENIPCVDIRIAFTHRIRFLFSDCGNLLSPFVGEKRFAWNVGILRLTAPYFRFDGGAAKQKGPLLCPFRWFCLFPSQQVLRGQFLSFPYMLDTALQLARIDQRRCTVLPFQGGNQPGKRIPNLVR